MIDVEELRRTIAKQKIHWSLFATYRHFRVNDVKLYASVGLHMGRPVAAIITLAYPRSFVVITPIKGCVTNTRRPWKGLILPVRGLPHGSAHLHGVQYPQPNDLILPELHKA